MISHLKKYKHIIVGFVFTILIIYFLDNFEWFLIDKNELLSNTIGFVFLWSLLAVIIYIIPELRANKIIALKMFGLLVLFICILAIDYYMSIPDNPITILSMVVLGILIIFFLAPRIVFQYKLPLLIYYVTILGYFLYRRVFINDLAIYYQQQKEVLILLMLPFFILLYLWAYKQWKRFGDLKIEKGKAELELLKSQINPHFLFNTLNNLYGLTVEKSDEAPGVVLKLSDMLRYTIYEGKEEFVFLKDEIIYLENYIGLHQIRHQKNVDIIFNYDIEKDIKIAPLLYIILLENAFKHGVERLTKDAYIHIDISAKGKLVIFQIENNFEAQEFKAKKGIGLDNLKQRLLLIYPKKHSLKIEKETTVHKITLQIHSK